MNKYILPVFAIILSSCTKIQVYRPSDKDATNETAALYAGMQQLAAKGTIFGHHDDTAYGVEWKFDNDSSDVKTVTGSYPALYGWDLAKIEHNAANDINNVSFGLQKKRVLEAYERGGINTFCWHMDNPSNDSTAWDTTKNTVKNILPGGAFHGIYVEYLDRAARYLEGLKGKDSKAIPILFRPFHEFTGNWFWWGKNRCTPEQFKSLWTFTIDYLRDKKQLHNLLIVYSAADFDSEKDFLERYPGDDYADVLGFDSYCTTDINGFKANLDKHLAITEKIAAAHHKLACIAETGYQNIPMKTWWTEILLPVITKHKPSYVLAWRNADIKQYFTPYAGQSSAGDFKKFSSSHTLIFQDKLTDIEVYGKSTN